VNVKSPCTKSREYGGIYRSAFNFEVGRFLSVSIPELYSQHPFNSRLYGLRILLKCFVHEEKILALSRSQTKSVGFTTCSLVTILIVLCRLPLLALLWFIKWNGGWMQFNIILCVGLQNRLWRREYWSYRFNYPTIFMVKHLIYIPNVVGSDLFSSASKQHIVLPITVCQWTVAYVYSSWPLVPTSPFVTSVQTLSRNC